MSTFFSYSPILNTVEPPYSVDLDLYRGVCVQDVTIPQPPLPQPKLKVAQYNQTYCWKVKSISAMDF